MWKANKTTIEILTNQSSIRKKVIIIGIQNN